jgi:GT2 family glycosyltransferase
MEVDLPTVPDIALDDGEAGLGILVRLRGRPVDFFLRQLTPAARVPADTLDEFIGSRSAVAILRQAIEDELRSEEAVGQIGSPPTVSVVCCTRDRADLLEKCLDSLAVACFNAGPGVEIVVVDNAPATDATRLLVDTRGDVRYALELRPGLDFARNRALSATANEIVAFVDDDVEVEPQWLVELRRTFVEHPDAGCVTGLVLPYEIESTAQLRFELRGGFRRESKVRRYQGPNDPDNPFFPFGAGIFGAGCNMAFRRSALESISGFDEALDTGPPLPGGGDLDAFFRVLRAGFCLVYEPRAIVRHKHRSGHAALRHQYYTWGTGFMAFLMKGWSRPEDRPAIVRMVKWWLRYELRLLAKGALGRGGMTLDIAAAELLGGLVGLGGEYGRSQRRVAAIKATIANAP